MIIMDIGINLFCYPQLELDRQIELMRENGFNHTFFDSERSNCQEIFDKLRAADIKCDTLHAPYSPINDMWAEGEVGDRMVDRMKKSVDRCSDNGVPVLIVHLSSGLNPPRINDAGYENWKKLIDYATQKNVKLGFENIRKLANHAFAIEEYEEAGFCWDVGHENCFTRKIEFMNLFSHKLCALHLHDNRKIYNLDEHMLPYDGRIDYEYVAQKIAEAEYDGTIMLEVFKKEDNGYNNCSAEDYYRAAAKAANRLRDRIEEIRTQV